MEENKVVEDEQMEDIIEEIVEACEAEENVSSEETMSDPKVQGIKKKEKRRSHKALEIELQKKETEALELKDKYQRLMAEFENARKRTSKETSRMFDMGSKNVLEKLLPVVDNFERGLLAVSEEEKESAFVQGVDAIYKQLMTTLNEVGVQPMNAVGQEFNPDLHNAVMHIEDEECGNNLIAEEFQKGYLYKEQVLRHSMVKVVN